MHVLYIRAKCPHCWIPVVIDEEAHTQPIEYDHNHARCPKCNRRFTIAKDKSMFVEVKDAGRSS